MTKTWIDNLNKAKKPLVILKFRYFSKNWKTTYLDNLDRYFWLDIPN